VRAIVAVRVGEFNNKSGQRIYCFELLMHKADTVRQIAKMAFTDAVEILSIIEVLQGGNNNRAAEALNAKGAGRAAAHIQRALFTRLHIIVSPHPCRKVTNQRSRSDSLARPGKQESDQPIEALLGAQNCRQPIRRIVEPGSSKVTVTAVRTPASVLARWWASIGSERCEWHTRSPDVR